MFARVKSRAATLVAAVVLMTVIVPAIAASAAQAYDNGVIADKALSYVGQWGGNACKDAQKPNDSGGECRAFVNCVVWMVSGHTQNLGGSDYFQPFLSAGGTEIADINSLVKGDIVQVGQGTHTFIIVRRVSGSTFNVVDSNHIDKNEMVMNYDRTFSLSSTTRAFRMGTVGQSSGGAGTLYFVKTRNTGSGKVEVHSATPSTGYQNGQHNATWFSTGDQNNGWFQVVNGNLYFIKTKNTGSGRVEVHSATASSGYQDGVHFASGFSTWDAGNGWFQMDDVNRDGQQDLVFIKTKNTGSGRVEFFVADGSRSYGQVTSANTTPFSPADASNGWFQAWGPELVFIKTRNTGTGRVEYFRSPPGYTQMTVALETVFSPADQNNGWFSSEDVNKDGNPDLVFIKTKNTGSGRVELHIADGSRSYQQLTSSNVTLFSPGDADNGWFLVDNKQ